MGQVNSELHTERSCGHKEINYLVNKHPPVKCPRLQDIKPPCNVCKQRKIVEEMPKQKVVMAVESHRVRNRWDEMGNESRSKMPWKATCY